MDEILKISINHNQNGVTLVNALISIGLFGFLALAGATVIKQQILTSETASLQPNLAYMVDELRMQLSSPEVCTQNFSQKNAKDQDLQVLVSRDRKILEVEQPIEHDNGTITTSIRLSDKSQDVHVDGGTTQLIIELYHQGTSTKHIRTIKVFVAVDKSARIQQCYTTTGLADTRGDSQTSFWNNVTGTTNLAYLSGPIVLGNTPSASLSAKDLGLASTQVFLHPDDTTQCDPQKIGSLRYSPSFKSLQYCSRTNRRWDNLQVSTLNHWKQELINFDSQTDEMKSHGLREWDLCFVKEYGGSPGLCQLRSIGNKNWIVDVQGKTSCQISCMKPSS